MDERRTAWLDTLEADANARWITADKIDEVRGPVVLGDACDEGIDVSAYRYTAASVARPQ